MHPRYIHYCCDFFFLLPFIGIFISVYFSINKLDIDILLIEDIFGTWTNKPFSIIQKSHYKTCRELGMYDIIHYDWPGTMSGCLCSNGTQLFQNRCSEKLHKNSCKTIEHLRPYFTYKWKEHYLCSISSMKKVRNYFDLVRIKPGDFCAYKTKKCGKIDTLGNYLCIPENENCPLNDFTLVSNDDKGFELKTSNTNTEGNIYVHFMIADEDVCINHLQQNYNNEFYFPLFNSSFRPFLQCSVFSSNSTSITFDKYSRNFDKYPKSTFYKQNGIANHIKHLPSYPIPKQKIGLYGNMYIGWKKECERKEFFAYLNNSTYAKQEVYDILIEDEKYRKTLYWIAGIMTLVFLVGIYDFKYRLILTKSNKVEIRSKSFLVLLGIYLIIMVLSGILVCIAQMISNIISRAKICTAFFDLVYNTQCTDDQTFFVVKVVAEEFYTYVNKYFNIKILGIIEIIMGSLVLFYTFFAKRSLDAKRARKEAQNNFYNFD